MANWADLTETLCTAGDWITGKSKGKKQLNSGEISKLGFFFVDTNVDRYYLSGTIM